MSSLLHFFVLFFIVLFSISIVIPMVSTKISLSLLNIKVVFVLITKIVLIERLLPWLSILSLWFALFFIAELFVVYGNIFADTDKSFYFGDVYTYFFKKSDIVDFTLNDIRKPENTKYTNLKYLHFFFTYFIKTYMYHWITIKDSSFIFHKGFSLCFSVLVLWHFTLLQYLPGSVYFNLVYLFFVFIRKFINICFYISALAMFNPLKYHDFEVNMYFFEPKKHFLPKFLPLAFTILLCCFFVVMSGFAVVVCCTNIQNGVLVFF